MSIPARSVLNKALLAASLLSVSVAASAMSKPPATQLDTEIQLTNSTLDTLTVSLQGNARAELVAATIPPLSTRTVAKLGRDSGKNTDLDIRLSSADYDLTLTQQTRGTELEFSAEGNGWDVADKSDEKIHRFPVTLAGDSAQIAFKGNDLVNGGNVQYVIQEKDEKPELAGAGDFNVLSYNVWATTIYGSKKVGTRLGLMPEVMSGYDVLVLTEVFDLAPSNALMAELRKEYPYQSAEIFKAGKLMNSGTRIVSRWPFETEGAGIYEACNGIQCAATRGVIYAKIQKQGKPYHVFATHTQSSDDDANRNARKAQLQEMGDYIRSLNIPADEAVIMAGDFNVNKIGLPEDRDYMESVLNAEEPTNKGHNLSYDSDTNAWAEAPYLEYLDYTLFSRVNQQPTSAIQEVIAPRATIDELWGEWDLSDHYAARGEFKFDANGVTRAPFPYFGDVVHLRTDNGHYVRAMSGGGSFISAGSDNLGTWESFVLEQSGNGKVLLRARDGHYVALDSYLLGTLKANNHDRSAAAQFELIDRGNGNIALKADNGKFLRADFAGGAGLSALASSVDSWETFTLVRP